MSALLRLAFPAALLAAGPLPAQESVSLRVVERPRLVSCSPVSSTPCLRAVLAFTSGTSEVVRALSSMPAVLNDVDIRQGDAPAFHPFHVGLAEDSALAPLRTTLILIDISGSMLDILPNGRTRFHVAKEALDGYLDASTDGRDEIAVAPFGSRNVVPTIRAAAFSDRLSAVRAQVAQLTQPVRSNNTALFSSISAALDILAARKQTDTSGRQFRLLVLSDGKNDVQPWAGDDPDLLDRSALDALSAKVLSAKAAGIETTVIGFGSAASLDKATMERISVLNAIVDEPAKLKAEFRSLAGKQASRFTVTFASPLSDLAAHAAQSLPIQFEIRSGGAAFRSEETAWHAPAFGSAFQGSCSPAEQDSALEHPDLSGGSDASMIPIIRPAVVALVLGAILAVLWLWFGNTLFPPGAAQASPRGQPAYQPIVDASRTPPGSRGRFD